MGLSIALAVPAPSLAPAAKKKFAGYGHFPKCKFCPQSRQRASSTLKTLCVNEAGALCTDLACQRPTNRGFILFQYALFGLLLNKLGVWLAGNFSLSLTTA